MRTARRTAGPRLGPGSIGCLVLVVLMLAALLVPENLDARRRAKKERTPAPFRHVAVVPPRVEITRARVLGGVPKIEDSMEAEDVILEVLEAELAEKGYRVEKGALSRARLEADPDLHFAVSDLQARFDEVHAQVAHAEDPREDLREGRFDLGDAALLVAGMVGVDGLVFARGQGVSTGGGTKAAVFFLTLGGGIPGSGIELRVATVDGRSGRLVDLVGASNSGPVLKKTEKIVSRPIRRAVEALSEPGEPSTEVAALPALPPVPPPLPEPPSPEEDPDPDAAPGAETPSPTAADRSSVAEQAPPSPSPRPSREFETRRRPAPSSDDEPSRPMPAPAESGPLGEIHRACLAKESVRQAGRPEVCDCIARNLASLAEDDLRLLRGYAVGELAYPDLLKRSPELADLEFEVSMACWEDPDHVHEDAGS